MLTVKGGGDGIAGRGVPSIPGKGGFNRLARTVPVAEMWCGKPSARRAPYIGGSGGMPPQKILGF